MRIKFTYLIVILFGQYFAKGQIKDSTKTNIKFFKSELVHLEAESPEITKKEYLINSNDFVINLISKEILINYKNKTISFENTKKFDKYLKEKKISKINVDIYIEIENKSERSKTLEVFKILKLNDINKFNIITKK